MIGLSEGADTTSLAGVLLSELVLRSSGGEACSELSKSDSPQPTTVSAKNRLNAVVANIVLLCLIKLHLSCGSVGQLFGRFFGLRY